MRKTELKKATVGMVIVVVLTLCLLGILRARLVRTAEADTGQGAVLFNEKGCAQCHYTDRKEGKYGPGLKGLFSGERLPSSGRPVTHENVRLQFMKPYKNMPSYADRLTKEETDLLIEYMKTL
jgi:mono/diheme cytochrome c family protein